MNAPGPRLSLTSLPERHTPPEAPEGRSQTTVWHGEQLYTHDWVPVNAAVVIHWHVGDLPEAALAMHGDTRSNVKSVTQAALADVVGSTMFAALLADRPGVEIHLRSRMTTALAGSGIAIDACRIRGMAISPEIQDADVLRVLEELGRITLEHRSVQGTGP
jgi:regulator of protease activity HflC (stomatin/prohibitin superfamily)